MPLSHAVVRIDLHHATLLEFDSTQVAARHLKAHPHQTRQHHSEVRAEHEFFGEVCDALAGIGEVLVTGPHTGQAAFRHYLDKHRPALLPRVIGWETVDHPSEGELLAFARKYVDKHRRMAAPAS